MNDTQIFAAILGGIIFALLGGFLIVPIQLLVGAAGGYVDAGDDSWGLLWIILMVVSGVAGFIFSARWARKRYRSFQT